MKAGGLVAALVGSLTLVLVPQHSPADAVPRKPAGPDAVALVARLHRQAEQLTHATFAAAASPHRHPARFYVDAVRGEDSNPGTSPGRAWRTLTRAARERYRGGDQLLLRGGERFTQTLALGRADVRGTTSRHPLMIASYGRGRATLSPRGASGLIVTNVAGVQVNNLNFAGDNTECGRPTDGIFFDAYRLHGTLGAGISIAHVDASGFCNGVVIGAEDDTSRIEHVRIADVRAHDNGDAGVITYDQADKRHAIRDVTVTRTVAYRNSDQGGIVLFGIERGRVVHSVAFDNGRGHSGDAGIWAFDSDRIVLAYDESYGNVTNGDDGDGFDLDGGVTNSVLSHDYAHDNQGIGFLICACDGYWYPQSNDLVAGNLSVDDGSSGQASAIYIGGGAPFHGVRVFSNRAYSSRGSGPLVSVDGAQAAFSDVHFHDNLFVAASRKILLYADTADAKRLTFARNRWVSCPARLTGAGSRECSPRWWRALGRRGVTDRSYPGQS